MESDNLVSVRVDTVLCQVDVIALLKLESALLKKQLEELTEEEMASSTCRGKGEQKQQRHPL